MFQSKKVYFMHFTKMLHNALPCGRGASSQNFKDYLFNVQDLIAKSQITSLIY
jgi:hypothetical protein